MRPSIQGVYIMPAFNRFDLAAEIIDSVNERTAAAGIEHG
jgi:hypothetical protein